MRRPAEFGQLFGRCRPKRAGPTVGHALSIKLARVRPTSATFCRIWKCGAQHRLQTRQAQTFATCRLGRARPRALWARKLCAGAMRAPHHGARHEPVC